MVVAGVPVVAVVDTLAVVVDKNATNVVKLVTSLATAMTVVVEVTRVVAVEVAMVEAMAAVTAAVEEAVVKLATPVVDLDTCHVIAPKARSATTVSGSPQRDPG